VRVTVDAAGNAVAYDDGVYPAEGGNPCLSAMPYLLAEGMLMDGRSYNAGQADARYKFVGNERDVETGFDYLGDRSYDSRIGRLLSVDPFASKDPSRSPYSYAANNPIVFVDINGDSLAVTGTKEATQAFTNTINNGLGGFYNTQIDANGNVTLARTNQQGPLNERQQALSDVLNTAISDNKTVKIGLTIDDNQVLVGSYKSGTVDMGDIGQIGKSDQIFLSEAGALGHEVAEQTKKQLEGLKNVYSDYSKAHNHAISAENRINGSIRGSDRSTASGILVIDFSSGKIKGQVKLHIQHNNITRVQQSKTH